MPKRDALDAPSQQANALTSLSDVRAFVTVAEARSFSHAAEALGISQPTVSQRIQSLENLYGLKLLDRRGKVRLTECGKEIFNHARLLISRANELDDLARDLEARRRGRISIGYSSPVVAIQVIACMIEDYPGIEISQSAGNTTTLLKDLKKRRIDAAILTLSEPVDGFRTQKIGRQKPALCLPATHPLSGETELDLTSLQNEQIIMQEKTSMTRSMFEDACRQSGIEMRRIMYAPNREALKEAVCAGMGIGVVMAGEIGEDIRTRSVAIKGLEATGCVCGASLMETTGLPSVIGFFEACRQASSSFADDN